MKDEETHTGSLVKVCFWTFGYNSPVDFSVWVRTRLFTPTMYLTRLTESDQSECKVEPTHHSSRTGLSVFSHR